jgi:hypothetical protein
VGPFSHSNGCDPFGLGDDLLPYGQARAEVARSAIRQIHASNPFVARTAQTLDII